MAESYDVLPPVKRAEMSVASRYSNQFSDKNLSVQAALALAYRELGISETDQVNRECVANLMAPLAETGPVSIERLKTFAVSQFRMAK